MTDPYRILGVSKSASDEEIKKAYRKLAHTYHPDKPGGNEAKFKEINEAYQVLGNKEKRAQYDRFGRVADGAPGNAGGFGFNPEGFSWTTTGDLGDLGDIFESVFQGFGFNGGSARPRTVHRHGADAELRYDLTLEEAFRGVKKTIEFKTLVPCAACKGVGHDPHSGTTECAACRGRGEVREERHTFFGNIAQVKACAVCDGEGKVPKKVCTACKSKGRVSGAKRIELEIKPGIEDKQIIKIKGAGEAGERGSSPGDLYVVVRMRPHPRFTREKTNLLTERDISLMDLLLRRDIALEDIDGARYTVALPEGFNVREKLKVPHRGMPRFGESPEKPYARGDLYISLNLRLPRSLSKKARELVEKLGDELK